MIIYSLLIAHYSLLIAHYSLLITHYSLLIAHYSLLITHYSLLTPHSSLLTILHCHIAFDMRVRVVVGEGEIGVVEAEDVLNVGIDKHLGQGPRLAGELQFHLLEVVAVDMRVAEGMHKIAVLQSAHLCYHHGKQCVRRYVERHPEENIRRTLVQLARQPSLRHVELEQDMAWRQGHFVDVRHVPRTHEQSARVGIGLYLLYQLRDLVDATAVGTAPRAPLFAVHGSEVAVGVGPLVPDGYAVVVQVFYVGVAFEEPQQFIDNRAQVQLFRCQQGETLVEVESHLVAEHAAGAGAGAVVLVHTVLPYPLSHMQGLQA